MASICAPGSSENEGSAFDPGLTVGELRVALQTRLRQSGALRSLKTQLRGMMLTDLLHARRAPVCTGLQKKSPASNAGERREEDTLEEWEKARTGMKEYFQQRAITAAVCDVEKHDHYRAAHHKAEIGEPLSPPALPSTWPGRVADCLIHNHLMRSHRDMSLAIFATEAEVPPLSDTGIPAEEELFLRQLLGLPEGSSEEESLQDASGGRRRGGGGVASPGSSLPHSRKSALHVLVEDALYRRGELEKQGVMGHRHQCGTQTDDVSSPSDSTNPLMSMECRLAAVDAKYALFFSQRNGGTAMTLRGEAERRMTQYKEDLHQLLRAEYEQKYRSFEQTTLQEAKEKWESHHRQLRLHMEEENTEKQRTMVVKNDQERQRLTHMREELEQQRIRLEKKQLEMISYQQECEAQVDALQRQGREQRDKTQALKLQCEKWEELCATRLEEAEGARVREMRRTEELRNVKADHAQEMYVLEEDLHHLRFRLHMLTQRGVDVGNIAPEAWREGMDPMRDVRRPPAEAAGSAADARNAQPTRTHSPPFPTATVLPSSSLAEGWGTRFTGSGMGSPAFSTTPSAVSPLRTTHAGLYAPPPLPTAASPFPTAAPHAVPTREAETSPENGKRWNEVHQSRERGVEEEEEEAKRTTVPEGRRGQEATAAMLQKSFGTYVASSSESGAGVPLHTSAGVATEALATDKSSLPSSPSLMSPYRTVPLVGTEKKVVPPTTTTLLSPSSSSSSPLAPLPTAAATERRRSLPPVVPTADLAIATADAALPPTKETPTASPLVKGEGSLGGMRTASTSFSSSTRTSFSNPVGGPKKGSSLLEHAAEVIRRKLSTPADSSSSSSASTSSSSSSRSHPKESDTSPHSPSSHKTPSTLSSVHATKTTDAKKAEWETERSQLCRSQSTARITMENEEDDGFKGVLWAARSQRTIIQAKEEARSKASSPSVGSRGSSSRSSSSNGVGRIRRRKPPTKAPWEMDPVMTKKQEEYVPIINRDSDEDDDSILYKSSSDSSF